MKSSEHLTIGQVYTRDDLRQLFDIQDATINNGIFQPKGHQSVWLFVTESKTADRTQYQDRLDSDHLFMDGQTMRRTDGLLIDHESYDYEVLLFYRTKKYEHPGAGFRYHGPFQYDRHEVRPAGEPNHFHFSRVGSSPATSKQPVLALVETPDEIRTSLMTFIGQCRAFPERTAALIRQTTYWVYDPEVDAFGPGKFVGYKQMTFTAYERALSGDYRGHSHDGHRSQKAISQALNAAFLPNPKLAERLQDWIAEFHQPWASHAYDASKWRFVVLADQDAQPAKVGPSGTRGSRQGYSVSPNERKAIEDHAVSLAQAHFEAQGYQVQVFGKPFDLYCWREGKELFVEVKGTRTQGEAVILTRNEVAHARRHHDRMVLFVVHGIKVHTTDGVVAASGGTVRIFLAWSPDEDALDPKDYYYIIPS